MSVFNFEAPDPDADDLSDDRAQDGYSSDGSTGVLRVYCTLFIALCSFLSMLILKQYKVGHADRQAGSGVELEWTRVIYMLLTPSDEDVISRV
jgi:hypothetical protein